MDWHHAIAKFRPFVVKISTPQGSGTGFLVSHSAAEPICGIATAAHVVSHAQYWEEPIRIDHLDSQKSVLLRYNDRAILLDEPRDTAAVIFRKGDIPLPDSPPVLSPEGKMLRVGIEVGWLGYPAVSPQNLCFFSGRISCVMRNESAYLVDGVAINGVSGGPAFFIAGNDVVGVGVVSAYIANRATGETLPGVAVVRDVAQFHALIKTFRSVDDAQKQQTPPEAPPPPAPEGGGA
jgi:hypothetical protein